MVGGSQELVRTFIDLAEILKTPNNNGGQQVCAFRMKFSFLSMVTLLVAPTLAFTMCCCPTTTHSNSNKVSKYSGGSSPFRLPNGMARHVRAEKEKGPPASFLADSDIHAKKQSPFPFSLHKTATPIEISNAVMIQKISNVAVTAAVSGVMGALILIGPSVLPPAHALPLSMSQYLEKILANQQEMMDTVGEIKDSMGLIKNTMDEMKDTMGEMKDTMDEMKDTMGKMKDTTDEMISYQEDMMEDIASVKTDIAHNHQELS
jgi:hypothetical protein